MTKGGSLYLLVEGLVEEDDSGDVFLEFLLLCCEEELTVLPAVLLRVLHVDVGQALTHGACNTHTDTVITFRCHGHKSTSLEISGPGWGGVGV